MNEILHKFLLFMMSIIILLSGCAAPGPVSPDRHLPVVDEMPTKPAGINTINQAGDFISFYPGVVTQTDSPWKIDNYRVECSVAFGLMGGYFTLAVAEDRQGALFAFTSKGPVKNVNKVINPGPNYTLDWGFIYDRNRDGWVDYFTYLDGYLQVKTEEIAHLVPKRPEAKRGDKISVSKEEVKLMLEHTKALFTHNADDNFDGRSDAVVAAIRDQECPLWFYGYAVLRSRSYTQKIDEEWKFMVDIRTRAGTVPKAPKGYDISFFVGENPLETSSNLLDSINKGIRACRVPIGALPKE
jgi:hypothetical protein